MGRKIKHISLTCHLIQLRATLPCASKLLKKLRCISMTKSAQDTCEMCEIAIAVAFGLFNFMCIMRLQAASYNGRNSIRWMSGEHKYIRVLSIDLSSNNTRAKPCVRSDIFFARIKEMAV